MSTRKQSDQPSLPDVADITPQLRRRRARQYAPKWQRSSQSLIRSLIEKTGEDATWWISGYRYARARNGEHNHNPVWMLKQLLAEQWAKGEIREEDLTKVVVHFMAFTRQLKGMDGGPPCQATLRGEAQEQHDAIQRLADILFRAMSDGVIDAEEGPSLIEVLEELEAETRDLRFQLQHAHQSGALPEAGAA